MTAAKQDEHNSVTKAFELLPSAMSVGQAAVCTNLEVQAKGSERIVRLGFPAFLRHMDASTLGDRWSELCETTKNTGWFLRCSADDLTELSPAQIPLRLGSRLADQPFQAMEVQTADLFEIDCQFSSTEFAWPAEIGQPEKIMHLLQALRGAAGFNTPVGLNLPLGNLADLELCLTSSERPDFVMLVDTSPTLTLGTLHHIRQARLCCDRHGASDFALLVECAALTAHDFLVCLCLGASALSLDQALQPVLADSIAPKPSLSSSLLDGLAPKKDSGTSSSLQAFAAGFAAEVSTGMRRVGAHALADLSPQCLWSASPELANLLQASS